MPLPKYSPLPRWVLCTTNVLRCFTQPTSFPRRRALQRTVRPSRGVWLTGTRRLFGLVTTTTSSCAMVPRWERARVTGPGGEVAPARGGNAEGKGGRPLLTTIGDTPHRHLRLRTNRHPRSFRRLPATENLRPRHRMGVHPRKRTPRRMEPNQPPRNTQQDIAIGVTNPNFLDHFVERCPRQIHPLSPTWERVRVRGKPGERGANRGHRCGGRVPCKGNRRSTPLRFPTNQQTPTP